MKSFKPIFLSFMKAEKQKKSIYVTGKPNENVTVHCGATPSCAHWCRKRSFYTI